MYDDIFDYIAAHTTQLRDQRGVSARDMSLSLGQNPSYINKIENKLAKPSIDGLQYICDYFGLTLSEFFDDEVENPVLLKQLIEEARRLDRESLSQMYGLAKLLNSKK